MSGARGRAVWAEVEIWTGGESPVAVGAMDASAPVLVDALAGTANPGTSGAEAGTANRGTSGTEARCHQLLTHL